MLNYEIKNIDIDGTDFISILLKEESVGLSNLNEVKSQIQSFLSDGEKNFAIDLNQVNSINSSGLGILISCFKMIKDSDGDLRLLNANDKLLNIFKITKLDKVFDLS